MSDIQLPIKVGQKFLSNNTEVEIVCVTRRNDHFPVVAIGCATGDLSVFTFTNEGKYLYDRDNARDLRPIPVTITEGVEFSGPEYRDEFERLVREGRQFEYLAGDHWLKKDNGSFYELTTYRLVPQHTDANGNVLKVGDRVEYGDYRLTIARFNGTKIEFQESGWNFCSQCRKLKTVKRPLCANDLDSAPCPQVLRDGVRGYPMWADFFLWFNGRRFKYDELESCQWRPSADKPWGPCEVEEEVLA